MRDALLLDSHGVAPKNQGADGGTLAMNHGMVIDSSPLRLPHGASPRRREEALGGEPTGRRKSWRWGFRTLLLSLAVGGPIVFLPRSLRAEAEGGIFESIGQEVSEIFVNASPALVRVRSEGDMLTMAGTGFCLDDQGTIVTAAPILGENERASVQIDGRWVNATIMGRDPRSGVALLKVMEGLTPFLRLGDSGQLKPGSAVVAVGFPRNQPVAPSFGLVAGFDFRYNERYFPTTHIRANVPISPGQVGGPLLNTKGEVMGLIVTAIDEGRSVYALPSAAVRRIVDELREHGSAQHGWVGVGVAAATPAERAQSQATSKTVKITHLFEGTPAAASGLKPGDIVLQIGSHAISQPSDILDASFFTRVGQNLSVTVLREGKEQSFSFVVQERPAATPAPVAPIRPGNGSRTGPVRVSAPSQPR